MLSPSVEPDRVARGAEERRPGETAFILARRQDASYAFLGVGRWLDDEARWAIPEADYATWRQWGAGRATSRRLPPGALARAQVVVDALVSLPEERRWIAHAEGRRARVLGAAPRGGLRVDGGDGGFGERTVSLIDLAWVILAADDARAHGGHLDEARVNRLRYLDGTPKGATRWIDTGWALAAWEAGEGLTQQGTATAGAARAVRSDDGTPVDATFRVEPVGGTLSIVLESRGGTQGTGTARNTHYDRGLQLLLERLAAAGLPLADAVVESRDTARLSHEERRLELPQPYPVRIDDVATLKRAIGAAQARVGRQPGAKGSGNRTRRLRLFVATPMGAEALARTLEGSPPTA